MINFKIKNINKTTSTNSFLKKNCNTKDISEGYVLITSEQTQGKGQGSNSWESAPGMNLTFSLLLKPHFLPAEKMFLISKIVSLAIVEYLNTLENNFCIKWPNDIYYKNKKLAGILIENQLAGCCLSNSIIGIGLNVNQTHFISDAPNPVSLAQIFNQKFYLNDVLSALLNHIRTWYNKLQEWETSEINKTYYSCLYRNNGYHRFKTQTENFEAKISQVADDGKITLITKNKKTHSFYFKEVEFML